MKIITPDYYKNFVCIAGDCKHSCCIGWEIDVDSSSFEYYKTIGGDFGHRIIDNITADENSQYFLLTEDERCPFLNKDNLCDIIIQLGEDKLCQICADHPRYRNFFSARTEVGIGLCCEAAAELVVKNKHITKLTELENDRDNITDSQEEQAFLSFRERIFNIIQNRTRTVTERVKEMLTVCGITFRKKTPAEWVEIYLGLEQLDTEWTCRLENLIPSDNIPYTEHETAAEQLLIYFLYRHLADGLYDGSINQRIAFAVHAVYMICLLSGKSNSIDDLTETARMYSAEVEYSESNMAALLKMM